MGDLREQLRKAGLVSDKQLRQAKHEERVHATEVGHAGLEAERQAREAREREAAEARRKASREHEEALRRERAEAAARDRIRPLILAGHIGEATGGGRRFFFETRAGQIHFLDLSDVAARRLSTGGAAIVETLGVVRGDYCLVDAGTATQLASLAPESLCFWQAKG
jgi:uncharacterized protein YaiL (DUF2058 family)